ncbi:MlaD family protein [Mucilaginibacter galii]|uniref:Mammalian cell entry protein n=1 Tax=Mucilaginibacter galii TaxID=2005073 RepID=A0A917J7L5_9SPHI|nr:MlaD family protein [Mucilaginibacter galii]GGI48911.1 mammalian cell entry protein [Mucilaginibacter galii]
MNWSKQPSNIKKQLNYITLKISNETKIGILTVVGLAILILGFSYLKGNDVFSSSNKFYAIYRNVEGLTLSKPILVNGFQIGHVSNMTLQTESGFTVVEFKVDPKYPIPANTLARLESTDLLGSKAIIFELGNSRELAENKDTLRADIQGSLAQSLQPVQRKAEILMEKVDSSLAAINKILNPEFQRNVDRSFLSIANSLQTLEGTTKKIDRLVGAQSGHINAIMSNAEALTVSLRASTGRLNTTTANFERLSTDLANSNIKGTLDNANKAMGDLQATVAKINSGQGSLGLLLNDNSMYNNLNSASANLNNLFIDLKAHPKRYVSFSVFGRKAD